MTFTGKGLTASVAIVVGLQFGAAQADDYRAEFSAGAHWGDPEVSFAGASAELDTDTGLALSVAGWRDNVIDQGFSVGLEYLRAQDGDYNESASASVLGATLTGTLSIDPTIDALLANVAWRWPHGKWHPSFGAGIGAARVDADISASAAVTVGGQTFTASGSASDDDTVLAGHFFAGVDYDVTDDVYVGVGGSYFLADAELFGADVEIRTFTAKAKVGIKF